MVNEKDWKDVVFISPHSVEQLRSRCGVDSTIPHGAVLVEMGRAVQEQEEWAALRKDYPPLPDISFCVLLKPSLWGCLKRDAILLVVENRNKTLKNGGIAQPWCVKTTLDEEEYLKRLDIAKSVNFDVGAYVDKLLDERGNGDVLFESYSCDDISDLLSHECALVYDVGDMLKFIPFDNHYELERRLVSLLEKGYRLQDFRILRVQVPKLKLLRLNLE